MRRIYISTSLLRNAVMFRKDGALNALAFAVLGKMKFSNSIIYYPTKRYLISTFHVSLGVLNRILEYGLKNGLFHYNEQGHLLIDPLTEKGCHKVNIDFEGGDYTLRQVRDMLAGLDLANQIKLQNDRNHRFSHDNAVAKECGSVRKQKWERKLSVSNNKGFSMQRIAQILRMSRTKARQIRNSILSNKLARMVSNVVETTIDSGNFDYRTVNRWYRETGQYGFLLHGKNGKIVCQLQNIYHVNYDRLNFRYVGKR